MFRYCIINDTKEISIVVDHILDSTDWIKKATINRINKKDNKLFQYAETDALNYEEIKNNK